LLPLLLRRKWWGKSVVTFHDLRVPYLFPKAGPVREWANRMLAKGAHAVIATNPEDTARLCSWGVGRVRLIPIGSNIANDPPEGYDRHSWRSGRGIGRDTCLLAHFGFLNSTKGLDDLLRAVALLKQSGDYRLMMVGGGLGSSDPTNRKTARTLDALARELGVQDALLWTGYLPPREVSAALLSADMAVLPYSDGASFRRGSLLAAIEHRLPIVTTVSRESEVSNQGSEGDGWPNLEDGENVLLVEAGSSVALAEAVRRLAGDASLRLKLSEGASELARFFGWERIAEMHRELYWELEQ
jgi:glycosyltransferase involved in cell wall biosynthesis